MLRVGEKVHGDEHGERRWVMLCENQRKETRSGQAGRDRELQKVPEPLNLRAPKKLPCFIQRNQTL